MTCEGCSKTIFHKRLIICTCGNLYCGDCVREYECSCPECSTHLNMFQQYKNRFASNEERVILSESSRVFRETYTPN